MGRNVNFFDSKTFVNSMNVGSANSSIAKARKIVYNSVMENEKMLRQAARSLGYFDAKAENMMPSQLGATLSEASLKAYAGSITGFLSLERALHQMVDIVVYKDVVTKAGAKVMPNIGEQKPRNRAEKNTTSALTASTDASVDLGVSVMPKSIKVVLNIGGTSYEAVDNGKGALMIEGGIGSGSVNYGTGVVTITLASEAAASDSMTVTYAENQIDQQQGSGRTTIKQGYWPIRATINKFEYEADLITTMISQNTLGGDILADLKQSVYDEQTLQLNDAQVNCLKNNYAGTTLTIDLSAFSVQAGRFSALLSTFQHGIASVDSELAKKVWKVVAASAYVVGNGLSTLFESLPESTGWQPNNTGFVNGIVGFYKNRAVIRHLSLDDYEGYAIYKTADIAPTAVGILLPATDLPLVGNFNNTNEVAGGIYAVDGVTDLAMDLAQRFVCEMPEDFMVVA
jgi:hypothetical protein